MGERGAYGILRGGGRVPVCCLRESFDHRHRCYLCSLSIDHQHSGTLCVFVTSYGSWRGWEISYFEGGGYTVYEEGEGDTAFGERGQKRFLEWGVGRGNEVIGEGWVGAVFGGERERKLKWGRTVLMVGEVFEGGRGLR